MSMGAADGDLAARHYRVFISYSHSDTKWANWLMRRLEGYRVPARFHGQPAPIGVVGSRLAPVFRDRDELPTTSDLGETIQTALRESATLVVICSPASAQSHWVQEEILTFKRMGGSTRVFAFIVEGEPKAAGTSEDCFSPALRSALAPDGMMSTTPAEHVAADARPQGDGREDAFVRLVSGLLGVGFDELRQRELQRRYRRLTWIALGSALGMAITLGLAVLAWQARNDAQRRQEQAEGLLSFMVGDLRTQLAKLNKLEVLDAVGEKAMAYFATLNTRDLSDAALTRQVAVLRQIGENRNDQGRYPEAMRSFLAAYESAKVLAARHPENGEMLFERAQAEYWVGYVLRKRGELAAMTEWLVRYRDSGAALVALNPAEPRWQKELAWGHHNLAVVDLDAGKLDDARRGFLGELATLEQRAAAKPADLELQFRTADAISFLGSIAERSGNLGEAATRCADVVARFEALMRAEPINAKWRLKLADALALHASVLAITGERSAAMAQRGRAKAMFDALVAGDPKNRTLLKRALNNRLKEAGIQLAEGDQAGFRALVQETRGALEQLSAATPADREVTMNLSIAWRLWAQLLAAAGEPGVDHAIARAIDLGEAMVTGGRATEVIVCEAAQTRITAAQLLARAGDRAAASLHARRALELLGPRCDESNHWRALDPAARAFALLGDTEHQRAIIARLDRMNYHAMEPWPTVGPQ